MFLLGTLLCADTYITQDFVEAFKVQRSMPVRGMVTAPLFILGKPWNQDRSTLGDPRHDIAHRVSFANFYNSISYRIRRTVQVLKGSRLRRIKQGFPNNQKGRFRLLR
jgi:hypothetical protein